MKSHGVEPEPYDLEADVEAWKARAKTELGEKAPVAVAHDVFVIAGAPRSNFRQTMAVVDRALDAYLDGRFGKKPAKAVGVYLFPNAGPYNAWCKKYEGHECISIYGFYKASERLIVMNVGLGVGTLTHELVHPIVETDFPRVPDWINEGIASLYEQFIWTRDGGITGGKNWRHPRLIQAFWSKQEKDWAQLPNLFGMEDRVFRGDREDLNYAMARYFAQWMDTKGWLWPFYQRWRDDFANDPTGARSFQTVTGKTPEEANAQWTRWVKAL